MAIHFSEEDFKKLKEEQAEIYQKRNDKASKEEIENLDRKGKIRYFFDYHFKKLVVIAVVAVLLVVWFAQNLVRKPADALFVVIRHDVIDEERLEDFKEEIEDYLKINKKIEQVTVELCSSDRQLQTYIFGKVADVVIMDEENFERWGNADYFFTAEEDKEVSFYQDYEEKYRYRTYHLTLDDAVDQKETGKLTPKDSKKYNCALYLTDSEKYKALSVGIKNPVAAISKVTKHAKNAEKFIRYMMDNNA